MRVISWNSFIASAALRGTECSMSIGVFDGVHLGHRRLIEAVTSSGADESIVLTFRFNPRRFLKPQLFPGDISSLKQKLSLLEDMGIDTVLLIDFSNDFSKLSGREFIVRIQQNCTLTLLVLGDNFRCGYKGETNAYNIRDILADYQVEVDVEAPVTWKGATLSSTRIRAAIREGDLDEARRMMDRPFSLDLASTSVEYREGFSRVEKASLHQVLPPPGRYLVDIHTPNRSIRDELYVDHEELMWSYHGEKESKTIDFLDKAGEGA